MSLWTRNSAGFTVDMAGGNRLVLQSNNDPASVTGIGILSPNPLGPGSGAYPPLWGRTSTGKRDIVSAKIAPGPGPFNLGTIQTPHLEITVTGLATSAGNVSNSIAVNTLAVNNLSQIWACVKSYTGTYGVNGVPMAVIEQITPGVGFTFRIANVHGTKALDGDVTVIFTIEDSFT